MKEDKYKRTIASFRNKRPTYSRGLHRLSEIKHQIKRATTYFINETPIQEGYSVFKKQNTSSRDSHDPKII